MIAIPGMANVSMDANSRFMEHFVISLVPKIVTTHHVRETLDDVLHVKSVFMVTIAMQNVHGIAKTTYVDRIADTVQVVITLTKAITVQVKLN